MSEQSSSNDYPMISSDMRVLCQAINEGWQVPDSMRASVVARLGEIVANKESSKREVTRASMALMTIDKIKLSAIATAKAVSDKSQPVVIVQQAAQDDGVRRLIESASEEQLVVIADLLRQSTNDAKRESDLMRESAATA